MDEQSVPPYLEQFEFDTPITATSGIIVDMIFEVFDNAIAAAI